MIFITMGRHAGTAVIRLTVCDTWRPQQSTGPISLRSTRAPQAHGSWPLAQLQADL
jgi:hypothetical protein